MTRSSNDGFWTSLAMLAGFAALALSSCGEDDPSGVPNAGAGSGGLIDSGGEAGEGGDSRGGGAGSNGVGGAGASGGSGGDAGASGAAGGGEPECNGSASPKDARCLVSDDHAVFVAPGGDDEDAGTMGAPVATFGRALELAARADKIVIACSGTYDERIRIESGVGVYGGFACDDGWEYSPAARSRLEPSDLGYVLEIRDVPQRVVIEDVEFVARNAAESGKSSVAGFVVGFGNVVLRRVRLEAGEGVSGVSGTLTPYVLPTPAELAGNSASGPNGGAEKLCVCPDSLPDSDFLPRGGRGGNAMPGGEPGGDGFPGGRTGGRGGAVGTCDLNAQAGTTPVSPRPRPPRYRTVLGSLTSGGWASFNGADIPALNEIWGTSGGGGASTDTAGGGGGGCAGCSGADGRPGQGGGASLALVVIESAITLEDSELLARDAGDGGDGGDGQPGTSGGIGGSATPPACPGGSGGRGADGLGAQAGAGGMSVGLFWKGAIEPVLTRTEIERGRAGRAGIGGIPTPWPNDGLAGVSVDTLRWEETP